MTTAAAVFFEGATPNPDHLFELADQHLKARFNSSFEALVRVAVSVGIEQLVEELPKRPKR
jgi:hypothetical protein